MTAPFRALRPIRAARPRPPRLERLLQEIGAPPAFADALLGDLAEECANRVAERGALAGGAWYAREALRAVPHLVWDAFRHGGPRGRLRACLLIAAALAVPAAALLVATLRDGPAVSLAADGHWSAAEGIVLNTKHPVQLAMRALDAKGKRLKVDDVRYRWLSGAPLAVSPRGVVTCARSGDATVRATLGAIGTDLLLRCRPVRIVRSEFWPRLVVGEAARPLSITALGPDSQEVDLLRAELSVDDSTVATLESGRLRPLKAGMTSLTVRIGDGEWGTGVTVYQPVPTLEGLRPDQRAVIAPVSVARGDTIRMRLPRGLLWLAYGHGRAGEPSPSMIVYGAVMCIPEFSPTEDHPSCLVREGGATLRMTHPGYGPSRLTGTIALQRSRDP